MDKDNIESCYFKEDAQMPNNLDLPVMIYRKIVGGDGPHNAEEFEETFREHGWQGIWQNGIIDEHHFHPDAHEALAIAAGHVTIQLGGESGKVFDLNHGDMVILPAGTGHKRLSDPDGLLVVGAYPKGQEDYALCKDKKDYAAARQAIENLPLPDQDPYFGKNGPLIQYWSKEDF
jgi:uncharacterized protein YjlB